MSLRWKLTIWTCTFSPFGLVFGLFVEAFFSPTSTPGFFYCLGELCDEELLQVLLRLSNELRSLPVVLFLGPQPVGFYEGRQVLRGEVPALPGIRAPPREKIHAALLRQVPIQEPLHDVLSQDRVEAPAFLRGELPDLLLVRGAGFISYL